MRAVRYRAGTDTEGLNEQDQDQVAETAGGKRIKGLKFSRHDRTHANHEEGRESVCRNFSC